MSLFCNNKKEIPVIIVPGKNEQNVKSINNGQLSTTVWNDVWLPLK